MIIEEIMNRDIITIDENTTIETALQLLNQHRIRHLPIVNLENDVIGIISDRDIRDASPSIFHKEEHKEDFQKPISTIMVRNVITAHPLDFVEEVASVFCDHQIGCIPVTEEGKLIGIVTETDILNTLVQLMGANQPSSHIEVRVENITGKLADIAAIFKRKKVNIASVLVYPCKDLNYKILVFRVQTMDPRGIIAEIEKKGYKVLWPNMPGVSE